jgi:hypothetical protein
MDQSLVPLKISSVAETVSAGRSLPPGENSFSG